MEFEGELIDALGRLAQAVEQNNDLQKQNNMQQRIMIAALEGVAQEIADMRSLLVSNGKLEPSVE